MFHPGLYSAHDIWHHVARLYHYQKAVFGEAFPPYWIGTLAGGLGYPLFFFSYPLPYLIGLPILLLGINIFDTLKILFFITYFASGVLMFFLVNSVYKNRTAGLLAAIIYLWAPYRFVTILVAASLSIAFSFTFLPLTLWGIFAASQGKSKSGLILTSLGIAGIILSHLQSIIPLIPLFLFFFLAILYNAQDKKRFVTNVALGIILGLGLSSFYLLPALYYSGSVLGYGEIYLKGFIILKQLIYSKWGYGIINNSAKEGPFSFQLGIAQWLVVLATLATFFFKKIPKKEKVVSSLLLVGFVISILMLFDISAPIWAFLAKFTPVNYPYRFMLPAVFISSFLAGYLYTKLAKPVRFVFAVLIILIALFTNRNHLRVNMYTNYALADYIGAEATTSSYHEYWPKWAEIGLLARHFDSPVDTAGVKTQDVMQNEEELAFKAAVPKDETITINHLAYPGINLYVDSVKTNYSRAKDGRIMVDIAKGNHQILVQFEKTKIIKIGELVSCLSIVFLILIVVIKKRLS